MITSQARRKGALRGKTAHPRPADPPTFFLSKSSIEHRAESLTDPIECLRYLRKATRNSYPGCSRKIWIASFLAAIPMMCLRSDAIPNTPASKAPAIAKVLQPPALKTLNVWPVEQNRDYDLYSNGLRIENNLAVSNEPRSYYLIDQSSGKIGPMRTAPSGIVFHTTESDQTAFEPDQKNALQRIGHDLLLYVRDKRAYHFVIDRFGRVHRIVVESDVAYHAGTSAWADSKWSYVDLNASFLGVAFEAQMRPDNTIITEGQLRAAKALTEMLRSKYNLPAEDCVVHAQISINPANWGIGLHTDWGFGFPFRELGLPDNYQMPNPNIYLFGFEYDSTYTARTGPALWNGLAAADARVHKGAVEHGMTPAEYRKILQKRFREALSAVHKNAGEENPHESN